MPPLAERNLFHDRIRLAVTLTGVVFAVVLIVVQLGLFEGFSHTTMALVDNSRVDVLTRQQFSSMTRHYWLFNTGAGMAVLMAAVLGLVVGVVVVAQTIYSTTMDHLREFGTLKAMGATNGYIYRVIMKQAVIAAVLGYALGIVLSVFIVHESGKGGANIELPWQLGVGMFGVMVMMCLIAAFVSINKVTKLDPALVFK